MASSIGSDIFALTALVTISLFVLILLRHYLPLRSTPGYLLVPVFLALALPILLVLLVPIDLASAGRQDAGDSSEEGETMAKAIWLPGRVLLASWRIAYWLTFALTWFILPLLGEYVDSGDRTPRDKMLYSLRSNARYQLTVLACGIAGITYMFLQNGFRLTSVKASVMALAYCWSLIQAIYLMGHGLVAVPRRLIRHANISRRLRRLQERAPKLHDRLEDSVAELKELDAQVTQLHQRKLGLRAEQQAWVDELFEASSLSNMAVLPSTVLNTPAAQGAPPVPAAVTDRYLADLSRRLMRARHKRARFVYTWNELVQEAGDTQAILDSRASRKLEFKTGRKPRIALFGLLNPFTRYHLHNHVIPALSILLGAVLAVVSVCVVWSELVKHAAPRLSIITYIVVRNPNHDAGGSDADAMAAASISAAAAAATNSVSFFRQVLTSLILTYMCLAALSSLGAVPVWGNRALVPRMTYPESATWYAGQVAKLTVPLAFNFVTLLPRSVYVPTKFYTFLGNLIELTLFGRGFDNWFQFAILLPVAAALFNIYGRVGKLVEGMCGLDRLMGARDDDDDMDEEQAPAFGTGSWREGRDLIERELRERADAASVPLIDSRGPSLDISRNNAATNASNTTPPPNQSRYRDEPTLTLGPAAAAYNEAHEDRRARYAADREQRQRERMDAATRAAAQQQEEEGDEGVFEGFAHRVRNTIDGVEPPDWFVKRPKWMGGQGDGEDGAGGAGGFGRAGAGSSGGGRGGGGIGGRGRSGDESDSDNEFTRTIGRIFGGNRNEGRLRL